MDNKTVEFLKYFSRLENALESMPRVNAKTSFAQKVREAAKYNYIIRQEREMLDSLRELRNVLVHEAGNVIIAVPSEEALDAIRRICISLEKPARVQDVIKHPLVTMKSSVNLAAALRKMKKTDHSQIPVYESGDFVGLLTGNAIARWMTDNMDEKDDLVKSLNDVPISQVLQYCEKKDEVTFVHKDIRVDELLSEISRKPSTSGVYILSQNGRASEKPLGIITMADYLLLKEALD